MTARVLVIGYGNELRRDDAAGRWAARAVAGWRLPGFVGVAVHQLTPELVERIAEADRVIFVDAGQGEVVTRRPLSPGGDAPTLGHLGDPCQLLALAEALHGRRPEAWLITVPAPDLSFGEGLSAAAEQGLSEALRQIGTLAGAP